MKITIYELLGMIKDGKAPKRIKSEGHYYDYDEIEKDYYEGNGYEYEYLFKNTPNDRLNDEVEILEEKKIPERVLNAKVFDVPKLNNMELSNIALTNKEDIKIIKDILNQVIDYLKSKGDE